MGYNKAVSTPLTMIPHPSCRALYELSGVLQERGNPCDLSAYVTDLQRCPLPASKLTTHGPSVMCTDPAGVG